MGQATVIEFWPKPGYLKAPLTCGKCGCVVETVSISLAGNGAFRADCQECGSYVKWIAPRDFSLKPPERATEEPECAFLVHVVTKEGNGETEEVAGVFETVRDAKLAQANLTALGLDTRLSCTDPGVEI